MIRIKSSNQYAGLSLSVFDHNLSLPRHRWYTFKEGFSERLVLNAVDAVSSVYRKTAILDPFSGSGTTLVSAGRLGLSAAGIEVNPFLSFAAKAKCTAAKFNRGELQRQLEKVLVKSADEVLSPLEGISTFTEHGGNKKWLFNRSVLRGFTAIDRSLSSVGKVYAPLRLALLASLMDCGNAKRDGKCLRYKRGWQSLGYTSADLRRAFRKRAEVVLDDLTSLPFFGKNIRLLEGDARKKLSALEPKSFDVLVTSPPYLNSFDYSDVYRPELFAGDFVACNGGLRRIRLSTMRSHVQVGWEPANTMPSSLIPPIMSRLAEEQLWDKRLPSMIQSYFVDIETVLKSAARLVRPKGQAWIVVGTSAYGGIEIPVDLIIADIGIRSGWRLREINVLRQLRAAGQHFSRNGVSGKLPLRESLIILERAGRLT